MLLSRQQDSVMRHFRGYTFPVDEFRPLYSDLVKPEAREFSAGLPVTRIDRTECVEVLVGERTFSAGARMTDNFFQPDFSVEVLPVLAPFEILPLLTVDHD